MRVVLSMDYLCVLLVEKPARRHAARTLLLVQRTFFGYNNTYCCRRFRKLMLFTWSARKTVDHLTCKGSNLQCARKILQNRPSVDRSKICIFDLAHNTSTCISRVILVWNISFEILVLKFFRFETFTLREMFQWNIEN